MIVEVLWLTNSTVLPDFTSLSMRARHLLLELRVADRQHLVDDEDLAIHVGRDRERQPHVHAAGIVLHRRVDERLDLGERHDLVESALDLLVRMPMIAPLRKTFSRPVSSG